MKKLIKIMVGKTRLAGPHVLADNLHQPDETSIMMPMDSIVRGRLTEWMHFVADGYFAIQTIQFDVPFPPFDHALRVTGRFLTDTERAYDALAERVRGQGWLVFFREEEGAPVIYVVKGELPEHQPNWWVFSILLGLTLASVFFVGGMTEQGMDWGRGASFAFPLILILLFHEFGHFLVSRRNRMATSPPYFIPMPFSIFGTLGAVILMRRPPKNRKHLFQMAVAGPLGGLILAIPFLFYGLSLSHLTTPHPPYYQEGNSLFYLAAKWLIFHRLLPSGGQDVLLHNMAFAGWVGLFITGLNLIPAGQLDGGHVAYTLWGQRAKYVSYGMLVLFLLMSIKFPGWLVWTALLFFLGRVYAVPMDDLTPLPTPYKVLGYVMMILLVLLFVPIPIQVVQ